MKIKTILTALTVCLIAVSFTACSKKDSGSATAQPTAATTAQFEEYATNAQQAIAKRDVQTLRTVLDKMVQLPLTPEQQQAVEKLRAQAMGLQMAHH